MFGREKREICTKTIFLIDGFSFLYRAYYSLPYMSTPSGQPVRIVYGFCRIFKKFINDFDPHYVAIVWDTPSEVSAFRKCWYPPYKAQRKPPPLEMDAQRDLVKKFCSIIGLEQFEMADQEADDLIYSLARDFSRQGAFVIVVTPDKDLSQTISKNCIAYDFFKERWTDEKAIMERYGVSVKKLAFYFSLLGDDTDNIPGVKGIGPSTAQLLVNQYSSVKELYLHLDEIRPPEVAEQLKKYKTDAFISYKLFKLYYFKFNCSFLDCSFDKNNWLKARSFFEDLNFKSLL